MFTRRTLACGALLLVLIVGALTSSAQARPHRFSYWGGDRVVYVYSRPYYRPYNVYRSYYRPYTASYSLVVVRRHHWRRHHQGLFVYGRPYYRGYRYW